MTRSRGGVWGVVALCAALACACPDPAAAQSATPEQAALLPRMLRAPGDHDVTFDYYRASAEAGDYEAAIGALDRLLYFNPKLVRAKYELGLMYFRLGSYATASQYLNDALSSPDLEPDTRAAIEALLPQAEKQLEQSRWSGLFQTGFRVQSNASYVPDRLAVRLGGQDILLTAPNNRRSDTSFFFIMSVGNDYDFLNQRGDILETRFTGFVTKLSTFSQYDVGLFDASIGPRLALAPDALPGWTVKPYLAAGAAFVGGGYYTSAGGGGVTLRVPAAPGISLDPFVEARTVDFANGFFAPAATRNSGSAVIAGIGTTAVVNDALSVESRGYVTQAAARFGYQTFHQYSGELAVNLRFDPPAEFIPFKWTLAPFGKVSWSDFDAPNPFVDPTIRRRDFEYKAGVLLDMPITANFGLSATVQRSRLDSNLPNYRVGDTSFLIGPTARF